MPDKDEVVIRVLFSLISTGTESRAYAHAFEENTHWQRWVQHPFYPGYTVVGDVIDVGPGVPDSWVGLRVCTRLGHVSHGVARAEDCIVVPDDVPSELAPWAKLAQVAFTGVRAAQIALGDEVLVIGAGPIGQMVARWALAAGSLHVTVADVSKDRLRWASQAGVTATLHAPLADSTEELRAAHGGTLPTKVIDTTGNPAVFADALNVTGEQGTVVLLGDPGEPSELRLTASLTTSGLRVVGVHHTHGLNERPRVFALFFRLLATGRFAAEGLNTHVWRPSQCTDAYELAQASRASTMGMLFDWRAEGA